MAKTIKYKLNKDGFSTTRCPNGFNTFKGNRPKMVGSECMYCKYREHIDFDNHVVKCGYVRKKDKG